MTTSIPVEPEQETVVEVHEGKALTVRENTSPAEIIELLHYAIEQKVDVGALERLQALHERVSDRAARAEFFAALTRFQELCPLIGYSRQVKYVTREGDKVDYGYAELPHIAKVIAPHLKAVGLSYSWNSEAKGETLKVICTLRHINGHSEQSTFEVPTVSRGGMSPAQKFGAAGTYARRQSLVQVLGLTTCEADTDAEDFDPTPISDDQAHDIDVMLSDNGIELAGFLKWAKVEKLADLPAVRFAAACQMVKDVAKARSDRAEKAARKGKGQR